VWEDELTVTGPIDLITKRRQAQKHRDHLHETDAAARRQNE
jgi:AGCS family alanine or glycine:cation symporter